MTRTLFAAPDVSPADLVMRAPELHQWLALTLIFRGAPRDCLGTRGDGRSYAEILLGKGWMDDAGRLTGHGLEALRRGAAAYNPALMGEFTGRPVIADRRFMGPATLAPKAGAS
jgi:hypothetical protein